MQFEAGARIGPYEILALIGKGGMGEVYRARDERIGRDVAIKFLPASFGESPDRLRRFEQEARSAGALNHPNLVTIHELGYHEGAPFIVMELLDGAPLRALLAAGADDGSPIPPRKAVEYAVQIADGLAAAHERGVVHRDLKPENIFVTSDGRVKILDFGLAKQTGLDDAGHSEAATARRDTAPGTVMGTVGYMSPEQVRGEQVDHRTDVFSFGSVLYEILTGRRAFRGDTAVETMNAILKEDPPDLESSRSSTSSAISPALDQIVRHCLEKNRAERFQSMRDVAFALGHLSSASGQSAALDVPDLATPPRPFRAALAGAVCGVLLGIAAGWLYFSSAERVDRNAESAAIPPQLLRPLTFSGHDSSPAVSPDGRMVAFVSTRDGRQRIWLRQIDGGGELALTDGPDDGPRWSPDGSSILFGRQMRDGVFAVMRVPALGGTPRRIVDGGDGAWSPDGKTIAFSRMTTRADGYDTVLLTVGADGTGLKEIARLENIGARGPRWSPDGTRIALSDASAGYRNRRPTLIRLDGTVEALDVLGNQGLHSNIVWLDDERILVAEVVSTTYAPSGMGSRIFVRNLRTGDSRTLLYTPEPAFAVDVTAEGRLVVDLLAARQNLHEISIPGVTPPVDRWLTRGQSHDRQPAYSRDGRSVIFSTTMSGNLDLWSVSTVDGALQRLTEDPDDDFDPAYGPDGTSIVWSSRRSGNYEVWIANADGSNARQLTRDGVDAENPTMTADGQWVVYNSYNPAHPGIWKIRRDGSDATRIAAVGTSQLPEVSPDGRWVAFSTSQVGIRTLRVVGIDGGESHVVTELFFQGSSSYQGNFSPGRARWSADGRALVYLDCDADGSCGLRQQDFVFGRDTTVTRRNVTRFDMFAPAESFSMSPDGTRITVSTREQTERIAITDPIGILAKR
jgi:eukaryotic-like serine/threonine-protein kinase